MKIAMLKKSLLLLTLPAAWFAGCATFPDAQETATRAEQMVRIAHPITGPDLNRRSTQDAAQQTCSAVGGAKLTQEQAAAIVKNARDQIKYPPSGKIVGDWKIGEQLVSDGRGQRIVNGKVEALKQNGALCINCHAMDPKEVNAGNLGPALTGYGTQRGNSEAVARYTYERIYNAWAFMPCSNMPRLGASGFLAPEQIAHVVAYLVEPGSPVNNKH
jgi:L-cysteine S-thiosulfotransferase